ncbi:MAG TPA: cupin domain-containing protein [Pseudolabrys sp.]|nr:cupin domain-containing protein [Pseudolabrys sp.]
MRTAKAWILAAGLTLAFVSAASAQSVDPGSRRQELKRAPLTGTNMEVVISAVEYKPGETLDRHIHHGEEAFYVLAPATVQTPDGKEIKFVPGFAAINARDVPHGGVKIVGDAPFKYIAVHIVDKGAPLYDAPK